MWADFPLSLVNVSRSTFLRTWPARPKNISWTSEANNDDSQRRKVKAVLLC